LNERSSAGCCEWRLPELVIDVRRRVKMRAEIVGKFEESNVSASEQHGFRAPPADIMPFTARISYDAIGMPWPVGLNDFGGWPDRDFSFGDSTTRRNERAAAAGHPLDTEGVTVPFDQVTVAPSIPAGFYLRIESFAFVGGLMKYIGIAVVEITSRICW